MYVELFGSPMSPALEFEDVIRESLVKLASGEFKPFLFILAQMMHTDRRPITTRLAIEIIIINSFLLMLLDSSSTFLTVLIVDI